MTVFSNQTSELDKSKAQPLVSCTMVTRDRREFVLQSIRYFYRQDYKMRELVIIDEGSQDLSRAMEEFEEVRYCRVPAGLTIGDKRNLACEMAGGEFIAHWDDDDWYSPQRLSSQMAPLLAGTAEISALSAGVFFDLQRWRFWRCSPKVHRCMFVGDVHGGTLVFRRDLFGNGLRYRSLSLAEDAYFLCEAKRRGARVSRLPGDDLFIYLRHANNAWQFECGEHIDSRGWSEVNMPELLSEDRGFYEAKTARFSESEQYCVPMPLQ